MHSRSSIQHHWLLVTLPLLAYFLAWHYNGTWIPLLSASTICLLLWGLWILWPRLQRGLPWPKGFLPIFMLVWFLWFLSTLLWSTAPYTSWFYVWVLGSLPLSFLFFVLLPRERAESVWKGVWAGVIASSWILCGMAFWQYATWMREGMSLLGLRPYGPLVDTNSFAAWMNLLFFPLLAVYCVRDAQRSKAASYGAIDLKGLFYLITLALILMAFFSTDSRGGLLAWACTMPFALWGLRQLPGAGKRAWMIAVLVVVTFLVMDYAQGYNIFLQLTPHYIHHNIATVSRALMWIATWHIFMTHPWLGTGLGTYFLYYPAFRLPAELASAGTYDHNDYLQYLAEGGLINLGLLLTFAGTLFYALFRLLYQAGFALGLTNARRLEALGLVLGVFAISGHALGNFIFYNLPLSLLAGILLGRAWSVYGYRGETAPLLPRWRIRHPVILQWALAAGFALITWNLVLDAASYAIFTDNGWIQDVLPTPQSRAIFSLHAAQFLAQVRPVDTQPHVYLARLEQNLEMRGRQFTPIQRHRLAWDALRQYQNSLTGIPEQPGIHNAMGDLIVADAKTLGLSQVAAFRLALRQWREGLSMDPESVSLRSAVAQVAYFAAGHPNAGIHFLQSGLNRPLFPYEQSHLRMEIGLAQWHAGQHQAALATFAHLLNADAGYTPALIWLEDHPAPRQAKGGYHAHR